MEVIRHYGLTSHILHFAPLAGLEVSIFEYLSVAMQSLLFLSDTDHFTGRCNGQLLETGVGKV
jgi:hypothetical protein